MLTAHTKQTLAIRSTPTIPPESSVVKNILTTMIITRYDVNDKKLAHDNPTDETSGLPAMMKKSLDLKIVTPAALRSSDASKV